MVSPVAALKAAQTVVGGVAGTTGSSTINPWMRDFEYWVNGNHRTVYPGAQQLIEQFNSGRLTFDAMKEVLGFYGINVDNAISLLPEYRMAGERLDVGQWYAATEPDAWVNAVQQGGFNPPLSTTIELYNRGLITRDLADWFTWRLGIRDPLLRRHLMYLRRDIPSAHELTRMLAFVSPTVGWDDKKYGLLTGYGPEEKRWLDAAGVGQVIVMDKATGAAQSIDVGEIQWSQQWSWPSTSDAMQMLFRLRPTGGPNGGPRDPGGEVVDVTDIEPILKQNRLLPYWHKKVIAISHRPLSRFQIAKALLYKHIDLAEAEQCYMDLGYNDRDAKLLAKQTDRDVKLKATFRMTDITRGKIEDAFRTGTIDAQGASDLMKLLGFTDEEADQAVRAMQVEIQAAVVKASIQHITTHVCHGVISFQEGQQQLAALGITADAVAWKTQEWLSCLTSPHKELTAGNICTLMSDGFISVPVAVARLVNLGYDLVDAEAFLLPCIARLEGKLQKAALDIIKSKEKAAKQAADAIKSKQRAVKEAQAELAKHSSPGMIKRWIGEGIIADADAAARLLFLGWPQDDIDRLIAEGHAIKAEKAAKANAKKK